MNEMERGVSEGASSWPCFVQKGPLVKLVRASYSVSSSLCGRCVPSFANSSPCAAAVLLGDTVHGILWQGPRNMVAAQQPSLR